MPSKPHTSQCTTYIAVREVVFWLTSSQGRYLLGPNRWMIAPIGEEICDIDRKSFLMYIVFGACCCCYGQVSRLPRSVTAPVILFCKTMLGFILYLLLVDHMLGYIFHGPALAQQADPEHNFHDHCQLYLKWWWRVTRFYRLYAGLCAQYLFHLARVKVQNDIREEDRLWLHDLYKTLYQHVDVFNGGEMLLLDKNRELHLKFEGICFPEFSRFLECVSGRM